MSEKLYFSRDTVDIVSASSDAVSPSASETVLDVAEEVTFTDTPWATAFEVDDFYAFPATLARPIEQQYVVDGETYTFKKHPDDLQRNQWLLDNAPIPLGHPENNVMRDVDDAHGFVGDPEYVTHDDEPDEQRATVYIPVTDDEALSWIEEYGHLSVGFYNRLDWSADEDGVDAYQRDLNYDHVALVKHGRCSREDGCGIAPSITMDADAVRTTITKSEPPSTNGFTAGDWVKWTDDGDTRHGQVVWVDEERGGVRTFIDGELTDTIVGVATSSLTDWVGPNADDCGGTACSCGFHGDDMGGTTADSPDHPTVDAPSGIYVTDGKWFAVGPDEHTKESTEYKDDAMYPVDSCSDVQDAWTLKGASDNLTIDESTLENRIQRAADAQDCDAPGETDTSDTMTDDDSQDDPIFDLDDLSVDAVADRHDGVQTVVDERDELADEVDELEATIDEKQEQIEALKEHKQDLKDSVEAFKDTYEQRLELVEDITALTDKWDREAMLDPEDGPDIDTLEDRHDALTDASASPTTLGDSDDEADNDEESTSFDDDGLETYETSDGSTVITNRS